MKWQPVTETGLNIGHSTAQASPLYPPAPSFSPALQYPGHLSLLDPFLWEALRLKVTQGME